MADPQRKPDDPDRPDPDATQRVPEIRKVVDRWLHRWPTSDPDGPKG